MTYYTNEGKTYCVVGTAEGTVTSASGVVIASFSANEQNYFTAPAGGFVTISDDTAIVTPVFDLAPSALVGKSSGGDSPSGDYSDWCGYIEYDDETGAIVDLSIPKYLAGNLSFRDAVFPENYEWKFDMPYLTNGSEMFSNCSTLRSFSGDLPNLTKGDYMFYYCTYLRSFSSDLSSLSIGSLMFRDCTNLTSWTVDLPNLTNGQSMFYGCTGLTEWNTPLPNLVYGDSMFSTCWNLTSFSSDLPNLTDGGYMFANCNLDAASVERILSTIPTYTDGSSHRLELVFSSEAATKFEEITGVTPTTDEQRVSYKGWTITARMWG